MKWKVIIATVISFFTLILFTRMFLFTSSDIVKNVLLIGCCVIAISSIVIFLILYKLLKTKTLVLKNIYCYDYLTKLVSANYFFKTAPEHLAKNANNSQYEIICFDIDTFKTINCYYGVEKGNDILIAIANALNFALAQTGAIYTRRFADNFVILKERNDDISVKEIYYHYILHEVKKVLGEKYPVSLSFGIYIVNDIKEKFTEMVNFANLAKQRGKSKHETTFVEFNEVMKKEYFSKINITYRMEKALKDEEFSLMFQPKISFSTLKINGAEALVRWNPRFGDTIYPDEFIAVFESNGFIAQLDMYVFEQTCKYIKNSYKKVNIPRMSVNLSSTTIANENTIARIKSIVQMHNIYAEDIEFEITESAIYTSEKMFINNINELKKLGFSIAIDDFGAGMSSFNRLSCINADTLKLDRAFFDMGNKQSTQRKIIVSNIINMAEQLNMKIVAEGVETYEQALWLKQNKCDTAQGYFFAKPLKDVEFSELLMQNKVFEIKANNF